MLSRHLVWLGLIPLLGLATAHPPEKSEERTEHESRPNLLDFVTENPGGASREPPRPMRGLIGQSLHMQERPSYGMRYGIPTSIKQDKSILDSIYNGGRRPASPVLTEERSNELREVQEELDRHFARLPAGPSSEAKYNRGAARVKAEAHIRDMIYESADGQLKLDKEVYRRLETVPVDYSDNPEIRNLSVDAATDRVATWLAFKVGQNWLEHGKLSRESYAYLYTPKESQTVYGHPVHRV